MFTSYFLRKVRILEDLDRLGGRALRAPALLLGEELQAALDADGQEIASNDNANIHTHMKNRNPMNLEKMRIGYKPTGFVFERKGKNEKPL